MDVLSPGHLVVIAFAAFVLFFGWKQLPDMSRSLARSLRIFKTEINGMAADDEARALRSAVNGVLAEARAELAETTDALHNVPTTAQKLHDNDA